MSKKHKKLCRVFNYMKHLLILVATVTGCIYIFSFRSLIGISVGTASFVIGLKVCVITAGIEKV